MELLAPRKYSVLAAEKIAGELKNFNGDPEHIEHKLKNPLIL